MRSVTADLTGVSTLFLSLICFHAWQRNACLALSTSQPSQASSSAVKPTHTVAVGKADHKFDPDVVQAGVGDIVEFRFFPTNHSVVRAEYEFPCIPYEMTGEGKTGFFSGFHSVERILSDPPTFLLPINDTLPVFFYCSAPGSCVDQQMVGVINPNGSVSLDVQKGKAADSSYVLSPGEDFPDETPSASVTPNTASAPSAGLATGTGKDGMSNEAGNGGTPGSSRGRVSAGAIAGIAIGAAALTLFAAVLLLYYKTKCGRARMVGQETAETTSATPLTPQTMVSHILGLQMQEKEVTRISELPAEENLFRT